MTDHSENGIRPTHTNDLSAASKLFESIWLEPRKAIASINQSIQSANEQARQELGSIVQNRTAAGSATRACLVAGEGLGQVLPGFWHGCQWNLSHPDELAAKLVAAFGTSAGLRYIVPAKGAACAGLILSGMLLQEAASPVITALDEANRAGSLKAIDQAAKKMGDSLGSFAFDSLVCSTAAFKLGEGVNARLAKYPQLRLQNRLDLPEQAADLSAGQKQILLAAQKEKARNAQWRDFHRYGQRSKDGKSLGFSQTINAYLGINSHEADWGKELHSREPEAGPRLDTAGSDALIPELAPENIALLSLEAKNRQQKLSDLDHALADLKDGINGPLLSVIDNSGRKALLGPEYNKPIRQIVEIAGQLKSKEDLEALAPLLSLHARAALQLELKQSLTLVLNRQAAEFKNMLVSGCKKIGVKDSGLLDIPPSLNAVTGRDNYTDPPIAGVIDCAVTAFPRSQSELRAAFGPIQAHENLGHDNLFPLLARFPDDIRQDIIGSAVNQAMAGSRIPDREVQVPGVGAMKKSAIFKTLLLAQANENTSDMGATAATILGTPGALAVLLQADREGGRLETRTVYGSGEEFDGKTFEPHGIDVWREKLCAEVIRQSSNGDQDLLKLARCLDAYADAAARPGKNYVFVNADKDLRGEYFSIPRKELDAIIPFIVKAQFDTPLAALKGGTLRQILPDMPSSWKEISSLADQMAQASESRLKPPFDKKNYLCSEISTAGFIAWARACAAGQDVSKSLDKINKIWDGLAGQYINSRERRVRAEGSPAAARQASAAHTPANTIAGAGLLDLVCGKQQDIVGMWAASSLGIDMRRREDKRRFSGLTIRKSGG